MKEVTINNRLYKITNFYGSDGLKISFELVKLLGTLQSGGDIGLEKLDVDKLYEIVKKLFSVVITENNKKLSDVMDTELINNYSIVIPLAKEVIEYNGFLSLFSGLQEMVPTLK
jgi:hypothetical protein